MYFKSKLLYGILKQYKLVDKSKINLRLLEKISKEQNILVKDLVFLFGISIRSYSKLIKGKQKYAFLDMSFYKCTKIYIHSIFDNFIKIEKVNREDIDMIRKITNLADYSIIKILGTTRYSFNKLMGGQKEELRKEKKGLKQIKN